MRNCIALKLNKEDLATSEQERQFYQKNGPRITDGSVMQMKPRDDVELEEIRRTMMLAFIADRNGAAFTLWPNSVAEEHYTRSLPRSTLQEFHEGNFSKEVMNRPPRYIHDVDMYTAQAADADQLILKGSCLFAKCGEVVIQLPRDATKEYLNSLPVYQKLESCITTLQINNASVAAAKGGLASSRNSMASFSQWLTRDRSANKYDDALISTTLLPYVCTLTLHEPFTGMSEESEAACRGATRNIITVLRVSMYFLLLDRLLSLHAASPLPFSPQICLANAENELLQLQPMLIYTIGLVGRSLIRQLEFLYSKLVTEEFNQDSTWNSQEFSDSASLLQADLEVVL
jgi:hypothetical protein